jgi:hypothetical protein
VATVRTQVGFFVDDNAADHAEFDPTPAHEHELFTMLDQLIAWGSALRHLRPDAGLEPTADVSMRGVPGFHSTRGPDGRALARMEMDPDERYLGRADSGTGDQPGNTGGDRFATPNQDRRSG